jgi:hypothetical protein
MVRIKVRNVAVVASFALLVLCARVVGQQPRQAPTPDGKNPPQSLAMGASKSRMTFFVTSQGLGTGADLADLGKADAHCQALAKAEGAGDHTWRAYLGSLGNGERPSTSALDRIGRGPWYNAEAELVGANREEIRSGAKRLSKETALTERGDPVENLSRIKDAGQFYCFAID